MQPRHLTIPSAFALIFASCTASVYAQGIITTIAGGRQFQVTGVGGPAINVPLGQIQGVTTDPQGNVYAVDARNLFVVKIAPTGVLTVVAGNGKTGSSGNGGPATNASFLAPYGIAADSSGNLFIGDECSVRKIGGDGTISVFAGTGPCGYSGDGGLAAQASLSAIAGIAVDASGNVYIADSGNHRIRKVTPQGAISTVAGNGQFGYTGDGVPAISTALFEPAGVAVDRNGVIYFAETGDGLSFFSRIRRVGADGIISTIAGGKGDGYSGDGGPANAAMLKDPNGIALDGAGDLYISDTGNDRVRRITPDGIIRTIAGTGVANFTGDHGLASLATVNYPTGIAVDQSGNVYFGEARNFRVRKIDPSGTITTYAGNGNYGVAGDGGQARDAVLNPGSVLVDPSGNVYVSDYSSRVRKIAPNGIITTVAGGGAAGFAGDGGPATQALLNFGGYPGRLALDGASNLYIADSGNLRVRKVDSSGIITTFAGNGAFPANGSGDGGPAVNASFRSINGLAVDAKGNVYIADSSNVRQVSPGGTITTFASGLSSPGALTVDAAGNVYATALSALELRNLRGGEVIRISPDGTTTVVVDNPFGVGQMAFDSQGNMYVPDTFGSVFVVSPSGTQTVVAGTTTPGFSGDDGPATLAQLNGPGGVALDSAGNLYIADTGNNRIRKVFLNPASGLFQPALQTTLQPGFYIAAVTLGRGELPGYWGMQVLAPAGVLAGGFYLGGAIRQTNQPPGFGAFYLPAPQTLHVHVDAQAAGASSNSTVALGVQLLDASRNPVIGQQSGGTSVDFTQPLSAGFYIVAVNGGANSPNENFQMALGAPNFTGGVVVGGFAVPNSVGFGAFDLTVAQQVTIKVFGQLTFGAAGAGGLRLTLYDASRNVIASVP